jgi:DNA repair exonuclease SbcCD ATPase subunit
MERQQIEGKIAELRKDRGVAALAGKPIEKINAAIATAEHELSAMDDAEAERIRRQREQDALDATTNRRTQIKRLAETEQKRLEAWSKLEGSTRTMVEAIREVVDTTESECAIASEIAPPVPAVLGPLEVQHRLRGRIAELLGRARIGFTVPGQGGIYTRPDWRGIEQEALASLINKLETENDDEN